MSDVFCTFLITVSLHIRIKIGSLFFFFFFGNQAIGTYSLNCFHDKSLQLCLTLCNSINCSLPGSSVHGISRQQYCSGLPFPSPGFSLTQGVNPHVLYLLPWKMFFFFFFNLALPLIYLALFRCTQSPRILISKKIKCIWKHDAAINHELRRKWQPTPVFLPRESPGQRSLVGCSLWGLTELDTIAAT